MRAAATVHISRPHAFPDQPDFETLATDSLPIQERCDDVDLLLLRSDPERAEAIRREGAAFRAERYSDDKLIACLDHFLFHREMAARSAA